LNGYKKSQFCIERKRNMDYAIFNSLYNTLVKMDSDVYSLFNGNGECSDELKEQFIKNGLWVRDDIDELNAYIKLGEKIADNYSGYLNITVAPTMRCNAQCAYCYEKGYRNGNMASVTASHIIRYITDFAQNKKLRINWFGGEPLLNTHIINSISDQLNGMGKDFISYFITNGSLINDEHIDKMKTSWHTTDVQITLDGTKDEYNHRKDYINKSLHNYDNVINNISKLAANNIEVHIRINLDSKNKENCLLLVKELDGLFGKYNNIYYCPAFLTGVDNILSEEERYDVIHRMYSIVSDLKKIASANKMESVPKLYPCMFNDPNSFCVDPSGNIYNCEHNIGHENKSVGTIYLSNIGIINPINTMSYRKECLDCLYFPKCKGGCNSDYSGGYSTCFTDKYIISEYLNFV